jgi:predicted  nucleic acid-binding Zn-ribbon protein
LLPALQSLIDLQAIESSADDARRRIADAPGRTAALDATLADARAGVEAAKAAIAANQAARREIEKELAVVQQRVSKYKDQLMEAKTNREYHAFQHEIATFSEQAQAFEGQIIEKMVEADDLDARLKAAQARLAADEKAVTAERAAIEREVAEMKDLVTRATAERAAIATTLSPQMLAQFDLLFKNRKGLAVARLEAGGHCSACRVGLRPHLANQVRNNDQVIQCDSCQRILYYVPPPKPDAAAAAAPPAPDAPPA